ncbi:MAG: SAM-dependent methyltransferase [Micromonosporaceae bacterium]|nr:SAM-dependent methyltransferase [Micromonosporaceae bacterium]
MDGSRGAAAKPATAARMYDYYLGGIHNFPADQEAARKVMELFPGSREGALANRAFLRRAVRHLVRAGVRQFLDIGSGIPTQGNVHEIAQREAPGSRVVYVDIDPVAVAESMEILAGNPTAIAIRADLRSPGEILGHPALRRLLDLSQPTGLLLAAVLHFVPDDDRPYELVAELVGALAPGSYLAISHGAAEAIAAQSSGFKTAAAVYKRQANTSGTTRTRAEVERFFTGLDLVEPGVAWVQDWRPDPQDEQAAQAAPHRFWAAVGVKPPPARGA